MASTVRNALTISLGLDEPDDVRDAAYLQRSAFRTLDSLTPAQRELAESAFGKLTAAGAFANLGPVERAALEEQAVMQVLAEEAGIAG